jgi:ABC-2 type transport system permease protein
VVTRLTVSVAQTLILLAVGIVLLGIEVQGSYATLILLAIIGGALFISMGYAVSGFARSEESAAPIANLIAMPMMFLSGVFFSRDNLPAFLETVTEYFPLTYLANSMREVTAEGSGLVDIWGDLLGLSVWLVASFILATRVFKWE